jgi:hypothetical protein
MKINSIPKYQHREGPDTDFESVYRKVEIFIGENSTVLIAFALLFLIGIGSEKLDQPRQKRNLDSVQTTLVEKNFDPSNNPKIISVGKIIASSILDYGHSRDYIRIIKSTTGQGALIFQIKDLPPSVTDQEAGTEGGYDNLPDTALAQLQANLQKSLPSNITIKSLKVKQNGEILVIFY